MVSTAPQDGPAGKDLETQSSGLFVALERRIKGTLKFAQEVKAKKHGQKNRLGGKEGTQAEAVGGQLIFELVNAALHRGPGVVIAPNFLGRFLAVSHKDPENVTRQIDEFTPRCALFGL